MRNIEEMVRMDLQTQGEKTVSGLEFLRRRVCIAPRSPEPRLRLAEALFDGGWPGEALTVIRELLLRNPNDLGARKLRELIYSLLPLEPQMTARAKVVATGEMDTPSRSRH